MHPSFSDQFLARLGHERREDERNDPHLALKVLVVIGGEGDLSDVRVVEPSQVAAFDAEAIDAVRKGSPFPPPPPALMAPDGRAYLGWRLARDPVFACSMVQVLPLAFQKQP